jgi:hypothetical protein
MLLMGCTKKRGACGQTPYASKREAGYMCALLRDQKNYQART